MRIQRFRYRLPFLAPLGNFFAQLRDFHIAGMHLPLGVLMFARLCFEFGFEFRDEGIASLDAGTCTVTCGELFQLRLCGVKLLCAFTQRKRKFRHSVLPFCQFVLESRQLLLHSRQLVLGVTG